MQSRLRNKLLHMDLKMVQKFYSFSVHGKTTCRQIQYRRTKFSASKANAYIHTNIVYIICIYIYIHTGLPIEGYGDATSHNITETKSHATFFLLKSDVGIHEAGFQDPANVQVWTSLGHRDKTKGSPARSLQQMVKLDYKSSSKRMKTAPSSSLRCMILIPG